MGLEGIFCYPTDWPIPALQEVLQVMLCSTCSHSGYEFDPGIHYVGEMQNNSVMKFLLDQVTDGQLTWAPLEKQYDTVALGDLANPRLYPIVAGKEDFRNALYEKFPDEKKAIDRYIDLLVVRILFVHYSFELAFAICG